MALVKEDPVTAHDALRFLINLSSDPLVQHELDNLDFIKYLGLLITNAKSVLADLYIQRHRRQSTYQIKNMLVLSLLQNTTTYLPIRCFPRQIFPSKSLHDN